MHHVTIAAAAIEFIDLLPAVTSLLGRSIAQKYFKLLLHYTGKVLQPRDITQALSLKHRHGRTQNAGRSRVAEHDAPVALQHDDTGREVIQNRLQITARRIKLQQVAIGIRACIGQLLRHDRKRARQPADLILALQRGLGPQVATRHVAHALCQQQQWLGQLVAKHHGQHHGTEDGQKQCQRQRAYVHALQASAGQRSFLVLPVGGLHGQGIGDQGLGQWNGRLQVARLFQQVHRRAGHQRQRAYPGILCNLLGRHITRIIQAFNASHSALAALLAQTAQQLQAGTLRSQTELRLAGACNGLARGIPQHHINGADLITNTLQHQGRASIRSLCQLQTGSPCVIGHVIGHGIQRGTSQAHPRRQCAFNLDVKPALNGTRYELVGHHINQQARQQTDEGKNTRQLEQQITAKAPIFKAQCQPQPAP